MRDELKDKAIAILKESWADGYESGVQAVKTGQDIALEEAIDDIKAEIQSLHSNPMIHYDFMSADEVIKTCIDIIDRHMKGVSQNEN